MSASKIRRNDPCPCGSGKKYKHCCMRKERRLDQAQGVLRSIYPENGTDSLQGQLAQIQRVGREVMQYAHPEQVQEVQWVLDQAETMAAYEAMRDETEAAAQALEAYRAEFGTAMQDDVRGLADRAHRLFSEERFARWRYAAADVHRAFEAVGYPEQYAEGGLGSPETLVAAIAYLSDKAYRAHLARQLMMLLPEYVAAERYLDAWLIQYSAFQMIDAPDESGIFLFEMFRHGYDGWATQVEEQKGAIVREFGLDPAKVREGKMSVEEFEAWVQAQMADPAKRARLEAYYAEHPMMHDQSEAEGRELEGKSIFLLEREDAGPLYLSTEEVQPWIEPLLDRLRPFGAGASQAAEEERFDDPQVLQEMSDVMIDISKEMAVDLFTPERVERLGEALKGYRQRLLNEGEDQAALYVKGGLSLLEQVKDPAENRLLVGVCFASLRSALTALSERARVKGKQEGKEHPD